MSKAELRKIVRNRLETNRRAQDEKSEQIWNVLSELAVAEYTRKRNTLMCYVDFQNEVRTTRFFARFLDAPTASMIVPFCEANKIVPFRLLALDELESGYKGIREPKASLRRLPERIIAPEMIELAVVPGLAFDVTGNRLGRGGGFYDRFLPKLSPSAIVVGLAFDCQVVQSIPVEPHDRCVDLLITETAIRWF